MFVFLSGLLLSGSVLFSMSVGATRYCWRCFLAWFFFLLEPIG